MQMGCVLSLLNSFLSIPILFVIIMFAQVKHRTQALHTESMPLLEVIHIQQLFPSLPHHHTAAGTIPIVPFGGREADHTEVPEVGDVEVAILATSNQRADQPGCFREISRFRKSQNCLKSAPAQHPPPPAAVSSGAAWSRCKPRG